MRIAPIQIPWDPGGNLGRAYARAVERWASRALMSRDRRTGRPEDRFHLDDRQEPATHVPLIDHDAYLLHRDWYDVISEAFREHPDTGLLCSSINSAWRGNTGQSIGIDRDLTVAEQLNIADQVRAANGTGTELMGTGINELLVGTFFVVAVDAWYSARCHRLRGFAALDHEIHKRIARAGYEVRVARGLLAWHRHRHLERRHRGELPELTEVRGAD